MLLPVFALFDRIVCCSRSSYESIPSLYKRLAGDGISIAQNSVNLARVDRAVETHPRNPAQKGVTVLWVGRMIEVKKPLDVLNAFADLGDENSRLVFVGDGPLRVSLSERVSELGLEERVSLTGFVSRERVYQYMMEADLLVSTSRVEGLPVAVLEAMACRCPVILSDIPSHRETAGGVDFIPLVRANDIRGFTERIRAFLTMPPRERALVGAECRTLVEKRFSLTAMHQKYEEVYRGGINPESRNESVEVQQSSA
jgi:glycosyltransferase involved in cell wall biosynthesis